VGAGSAGRLAAQASQFGIRALGLPILPLSARSHAAGGGLALFDPESPVNPAALAGLRRPTAIFTAFHNWRDTENPFGTASGNDTNYPLFYFGAPMGLRWAGSVSVSGYTDRTFGLASTDTVIIRDAPVGVTDTVYSKGGVNDLRLALVYRGIGRRFQAGLGLHLLTGTNRISYERIFGDPAYVPVVVRNELSFVGAGVSAGFMAQPARSLSVAAMARLETDLSIKKDTMHVGDIAMPITLAAGAHWRPTGVLLVAGHVLSRDWSRSDEDIRNRGGVGAVRTLEVAGGVELARGGQRPEILPLRAGARWARLPFPLIEGQEGSEFALTLGTGTRFGGDRGGLDLALERVWRREGSGYRETGFGIKAGVAIRP
jgi:hypothetical protein